jgi:hypothetical protein
MMCSVCWLTVVSWFISCQGKCPDRLLGPPSLALNRYWRLFPRGKAVGLWSYHSPSYRNLVKNARSYISTYAFIVWTGIILPFLLPLPTCQPAGSLGRLRNTKEKTGQLIEARISNSLSHEYEQQHAAYEMWFKFVKSKHVFSVR